MNSINLIQDPRVLPKLESYPPDIKEKLNDLRDLILETAGEVEGLEILEETLKWGELSYVTKKGSTIRMDWKQKTPDQYALYFNCNTRLVETFKFVYGNTFQYQKNRAIIFDFHQKIPEDQLKGCIRMALDYHNLKALPFYLVR